MKREELIANVRRDFARTCIDELWPLLEAEKHMIQESRKRSSPGIDWLFNQAQYTEEDRP